MPRASAGYATPVGAPKPRSRSISNSSRGASRIANFVKTGDPNGPGMPVWPAANKGDEAQVLHLDVTTAARPDVLRPRYLFLDRLYAQKPAGSR